MVVAPQKSASERRVRPPNRVVLRELCERLLVFAPHPDDECFVGGLVSLATDMGCTAQVVATAADLYQPHEDRVVTYDERRAELENAARVLGASAASIGFPGLDSCLDTLPQRELIRWMEGTVAAFCPTAVLLPVPSLHQDHRVVYEAGLSALRPHPGSTVKLVALYEYTLSAVAPSPYPTSDRGHMVVDISGRPLETKIEALAQHASQMANRPRNHPLHPDSVRKLAAFRGLAAGVDAAEWLYPLRIIL